MIDRYNWQSQGEPGRSGAAASPGGSRGSPGWWAMRRRPCRQPSRPTQNRLKPKRRVDNALMSAAVHVSDCEFNSCTLRRRSPSEKVTPSRDAAFPFLPFEGTRDAELFHRGAETESSQEMTAKPSSHVHFSTQVGAVNKLDRFTNSAGTQK